MPALEIEAKTALRDAIASIESLADALVREGVPTDVPTERERVYVYRRIENGRYAPHLQSRIWQETFDITVHIEVQTYGSDDGGENEARAFEIKDEIRSAIADDDTLDGSLKQAAVSALDSDTAPTPDGWITLLILKVAAGAITA